ncbi:MAG: hypothetical protein ACXWZI_01735 [Mycobacterium sp.]
MTDTPADVVVSIDPPRRSRNLRRMAVVVAIVLLLFGVPWWTLLASGAAWPTAVFVAGTLLFLAAAVALPSLMVLGHGHRHIDGAAAAGDAHYLVRLDQPVVQGLSRHGERTQLYTSRGTGFLGPDLSGVRPSEITLLTLRCAVAARSA